jgi:hypothetical protein
MSSFDNQSKAALTIYSSTRSAFPFTVSLITSAFKASVNSLNSSLKIFLSSDILLRIFSNTLEFLLESTFCHSAVPFKCPPSGPPAVPFVALYNIFIFVLKI